ncbi:MORN variant protein [Vibrio phage 2.275.O._10N.286.54.E11]|nr:MORN variant protein [Vibrio phage 2.275.O._10N.286.54.E11]
MKLQLMEECFDGKVTQFYKDENDVKQGQYSVWDATQTTVLEIGNYLNGEYYGEVITFNTSGKLTTVTRYDDNGEVVTKKEYRHNPWGGQLEKTLFIDNIAKTEIISKYHRGELSTKTTITKKGNNSYEEDIGYYYNNNNNNIRSTLYRVNGKLHGHSQSWHENGIIACSTHYVDGNTHGLKESFHNDGSLSSRTLYVHGKPHGRSEVYDETGIPLHNGEYSNGKKIGTWTDYFAHSGKIRKESHYDDNGHLTGTQTTYYSNGNVCSVKNFQSGNMHGITRVWGYTGKIEKIECYIENRLYGEQKIFAQTHSGKLRAHYMYLEDGEKVLARKFMQDLGIPYQNLQSPSEEEKVMITLALGGGVLFCDEEE